MNKDVFPDKKLLLRGLNEKKYLKKLEYILVEEGKRLLNSLNIRFMIVPEKDMRRYNSVHSRVAGLVWYQVGFERLYKHWGRLNAYQYRMLVAMKQILNKNNKYLLRKDEFINRDRILKCDRFDNQEVCHVDDCKSAYLCPKNPINMHDKKKLKEEIKNEGNTN